MNKQYRNESNKHFDSTGRHLTDRLCATSHCRHGHGGVRTRRAVSGTGGHLISSNAGSLSETGMIAANAVLSGTIDELGGGNFANGAITGAYSMMFNDLMHVDVQKLKAEIEKDGRLTFAEAKKWYKKGDGSMINVDINSLDLDFLTNCYDFGTMEVGHVFSFSTIKGGRDQFLVYGSVSAKYYGKNRIKLFDDTYNFESHKGEFVRNIETWIGAKIHGKGTSFNIRFNGVYNIPSRWIYNIKRLSLKAL